MISRKQLIWLAVLAIGDVALGIGAWQTLPGRMRVLWDFEGKADSYRIFDPWEVGGLFFTIWWAGFIGLMLLAARSKPALQRSGTIFGRMIILIYAFAVGNHLMLILSCAGWPINFLPASAGSAGLLEAAYGNWMTKFRRDDTAGWFRTSWMLKDDAVWERTNRIGWRLMVAHGSAVFLGAFFYPYCDLLVFMIAGLLAIKFWSHVYSLALYKKLHPGEWPN